jgi:hypothetical protein
MFYRAHIDGFTTTATDLNTIREWAKAKIAQYSISGVELEIVKVVDNVAVQTKRVAV